LEPFVFFFPSLHFLQWFTHLLHLAFPLDFYTEVQDLSYLLEHLTDAPFGKKFYNLNKGIFDFQIKNEIINYFLKAICELVEDFGLVSFYPLNIEDKESVFQVLKAIDKANGFIYGGVETKDFMDPKVLLANGDLPYPFKLLFLFFLFLFFFFFFFFLNFFL